MEYAPWAGIILAITVEYRYKSAYSGPRPDHTTLSEISRRIPMKGNESARDSALRRACRYVRGGLGWRIERLIGEQNADRIYVDAARRWRPLLKTALFIGIAGSASKTTTKELLLGVLSQKGRGIGNPASLNMIAEVAKTILRTRRSHDFCVTELDEQRPGALDGPLGLLQPSIGIVTMIGNDHWSAFQSRDAIAAEVGKLVACLPTTGTAVLNADDERVLAMAAHCAGKVITYGVSPAAEIRAEDIRATWPDRLEFTVIRGTERVRVRTQLCGAHWTASVLAAIGGGVAAGMTLAECAKGVAEVPPFDGRMQPVSTPDGVTFIRDDYKAPLWTVDSCFQFMSEARAKRKIIVIGELQDVGPRKGKKYEKTALLAQAIADMTIFVGPWASSVLRARRPGREDALRAFSHVRDAAEYVNSITRDGDLVLLKGATKQDHLLRIILARTGAIACWRDDCERASFCNECPDRTKPSGVPLLPQRQADSDAELQIPESDPRAMSSDDRVIVGLGNPGSRYAGTPHNVGYALVDRLATTMGLTWDATPEAWIARGSSQGRRVSLVKIRTSMNHTGEGLKRLSKSMSFSPEQCILVHDDLDMPIGSVRTRLSGGAGGHRGVASILEAFQTDAFRRVKVGIGTPEGRLNRIEYVLTPLAEASRATLDQAIVVAEARVIELASDSARRPSDRIVSFAADG
jgi:UDP-N-acetylmuramoyl-tripeptide--D-alanyl-D-alanine ligase